MAVEHSDSDVLCVFGFSSDSLEPFSETLLAVFSDHQKDNRLE